MDDQNKLKILKTLRVANMRPYDQESLSEIIAVVKSTDQGYLRLIKENYYDLVDYLAILVGDELTKISKGDREQTQALVTILVNINGDKIQQLSAEEITHSINSELTKEKEEVQISISSEIHKIITRVKALEQIKRVIRLINVYDHSMEIFPYCKKYINLPTEKLISELATLEDNIRDTKLFLVDDEKAKKFALDYLTTKGYPPVVLKSKNASGLLIIIERHYFAAMTVYAMKLKNNSAPINNQNELIDFIALFLLDQEDLTDTD